MMKINNCFFLIFLLSFFVQCNSPNKVCTVREWKVMDLYRNTYPSLIDTTCDDKIVLVNKLTLDRSFLDSVFTHVGTNRKFSLDTIGYYEVVTNKNIEVNGLKYVTAKVRYLAKGYNIDQEFLLYVVKDKGIYIQQEGHDKKLFLLIRTSSKTGQIENTENVVEQMIKDTILFPLSPS